LEEWRFWGDLFEDWEIGARLGGFGRFRRLGDLGFGRFRDWRD